MKKKAHINLPDSNAIMSEYLVSIIYDDGDVYAKKITNYSYSNIFDLIKENHEGEHDRKVVSIKIELIR